MPEDSPPVVLTAEQKREICRVLSGGCDRETAAKYARTTWAAMHAAMNDDREFAAEVRYQEAVAEVRHMLRVHQASEKEANWRASVWWLQTLAPERYGPRGTGVVNIKQLKVYLEHVANTLVVEVHNDEDRERLLAKLHHTAKMLEAFLRDESIPDQTVVSTNLLAENDAIASAPASTNNDTTTATDEGIE